MNTTNIIVTGLNSKAFTKKNGQQGRTFTIEANDGRKYVTWDAEFYNARTVGEQLALNYEVSSREWNGKTYTDYKIVTQPTRGNTSTPAAPADNKEVLEALRKVYARIEQMEKNLSAQITLTMGEVDIPTPEDVEAMPEEEPVEEVASENVEEESTELKPGDIPF